jgi:hypothetical protein
LKTRPIFRFSLVLVWAVRYQSSGLDYVSSGDLARRAILIPSRAPFRRGRKNQPTHEGRRTGKATRHRRAAVSRRLVQPPPVSKARAVPPSPSTSRVSLRPRGGPPFLRLCAPRCGAVRRRLAPSVKRRCLPRSHRQLPSRYSEQVP